MLAGRSIDSWAGSWTGKRASVGKLVTREQSPEFRRQRSPRLIHQSRLLCCDRGLLTPGAARGSQGRGTRAAALSSQLFSTSKIITK